MIYQPKSSSRWLSNWMNRDLENYGLWYILSIFEDLDIKLRMVMTLRSSWKNDNLFPIKKFEFDATMEREMQLLVYNKTKELLKNQVLIDCKWMYKLKYNTIDDKKSIFEEGW